MNFPKSFISDKYHKCTSHITRILYTRKQHQFHFLGRIYRCVKSSKRFVIMTTATVNCKVCLHKIVGWFQMTIYRRSLTYMNFVSIALRISLNFHVKWTSNKNTSWIHFILICPQLIQSSFKVIPCKQNPLSRTYCIFLMHVSPQQKTILQFCFLVWDKKKLIKNS